MACAFELGCFTLEEPHRSKSLVNEKRLWWPHSYQYHPLFREFLLARATDTFSQENLLVLRRDAAGILENAGDTESFASLLREVKDWEGMVRLIITHAPVMMAQGRSRVLEQWLTGLPEGMIDGMPWLCIWMGACRFQSDPSVSRHWFENAFERFMAFEDAVGIFLSWSGIIESIVYAMEDILPVTPPGGSET